ncbi:MAG: RES domain-containing protein [Candidatus Methylomirabilia bacterium]
MVFRQTDPRFPFLWETADQPPMRWHGEGEGPVHYFADAPDGAWAELLRREEITAPDDVATIRRALWPVELPEIPSARPDLPFEILAGGPATYEACRAEPRRLREGRVNGFTAPSAALLNGSARGWRVDRGLQPALARDGKVIVLFGRRPDLIGWPPTIEGRPSDDLVSRARHFGR